MDLLGPWDEVKFVIGNRGDFDFALEIIEQYQLSGRNNILFSPVFGSIDLQQLAGWILASGLNARMQVQMHKLIWPDSERGV
jgi:7-carboxy-7-deazaguanine synthase